MPALAQRDDPVPARPARPRPRLRALPAARVASLPGGAGVVTGQLGLAVLATAVAGLAGLRARAIARRRAAAELP